MEFKRLIGDLPLPVNLLGKIKVNFVFSFFFFSFFVLFLECRILPVVILIMRRLILKKPIVSSKYLNLDVGFFLICEIVSFHRLSSCNKAVELRHIIEWFWVVGVLPLSRTDKEVWNHHPCSIYAFLCMYSWKPEYKRILKSFHIAFQFDGVTFLSICHCLEYHYGVTFTLSLRILILFFSQCVSSSSFLYLD